MLTGLAADGGLYVPSALPQFARSFGVRHLGSIRSVVHSVSVGASAFGPLLVALGRQHAASYRPILLALTLLPLAIAAAAVFVTPPAPAAVAEPEATPTPGG